LEIYYTAPNHYNYIFLQVICTSSDQHFDALYSKVEHDTLREQNKRLQEDCETLRRRLIELEQQQVLVALVTSLEMEEMPLTVGIYYA
jgi:uncharacterized membrane protein